MGIDNWSLSTSSDVDMWDCIDPYLKVSIYYVTVTSYTSVSRVSLATLANATIMSRV